MNKNESRNEFALLFKWQLLKKKAEDSVIFACDVMCVCVLVYICGRNRRM